MREPVTGIVLAGGAGRRLRMDKPALPFGDKRLLQLTVDVLSEICVDVLVACGRRAPEELPAVPARLVPDGWPGRGPLGGLHAGLRAMDTEYAVVLACDMPFVNPDLLRYLLRRRSGVQAVVPVIHGAPQPLHAVYSKACYPLAASLLSEEENRLGELLRRLDLTLVTEEELGGFDARLSVFNVNYPPDLERAQSLWQKSHAAPAA